MEHRVRSATKDDAPRMAAVVRAAFLRRVASDWEEGAQRSFLEEVTAERLGFVIKAASFVAVCESGDRLLGVLAMPRPSFLQLLFVDPTAERQGVARALWEAARAHLAEEHPDVTTVELSATRYAQPAYSALGFFPISHTFRRKGSIVTRMACWLPARSQELIDP